jgi:hypothetical protein
LRICPPFDANADGRISVDEIVAAAGNAITQCLALPSAESLTGSYTVVAGQVGSIGSAGGTDTITGSATVIGEVLAIQIDDFSGPLRVRGPLAADGSIALSGTAGEPGAYLTAVTGHAQVLELDATLWITGDLAYEPGGAPLRLFFSMRRTPTRPVPPAEESIDACRGAPTESRTGERQTSRSKIALTDADTSPHVCVRDGAEFGAVCVSYAGGYDAYADSGRQRMQPISAQLPGWKRM